MIDFFAGFFYVFANPNSFVEAIRKKNVFTSLWSSGEAISEFAKWILKKVRQVEIWSTGFHIGSSSIVIIVIQVKMFKGQTMSFVKSKT